MTARASDLPTLHAPLFPKDNYMLFEDVVRCLKDTAATLRNASPHKQVRTLVAVETQLVKSLVLSLVLAETNQVTLSGVASPDAEIKIDHSRLHACAKVAKKILEHFEDSSLTFEEFESFLEESPDPDLTRQLFLSSAPGAANIFTSIGLIDLSTASKPLKSLASGRDHTIRIQIINGVNGTLASASAEIVDVIDADNRFFGVGDSINLLCPNEGQRLLLILSQLADAAIEVVVSIPRVPLETSERQHLEVALVKAKLDSLAVNKLMESAFPGLNQKAFL